MISSATLNLIAAAHWYYSMPCRAFPRTFPRGASRRGSRTRGAGVRQSVQLSRPLRRLGAVREPEAFRAGAHRFQARFPDDQLSGGVHAGRPGLRRARRPSRSSAPHRLWRCGLERRHHPVGIRRRLSLAAGRARHRRHRRGRVWDHRAEPAVGLLPREGTRTCDGDFLLRHSGGLGTGLRGRRSDGRPLRLAQCVLRRRNPRVSCSPRCACA